MFPTIRRLHLLVILFCLALLNPFTFYVLHTSRTYFWVVPLTLVIWFAFRWDGLEKDPRLRVKPMPWEIILGAGLIAAVVARSLLQPPASRIFGLFDMLAVFIALCLMLFGYRSLFIFWVPALFLGIIGAGYSVERFCVDRMGYAETLAGMVTFLVRALGGQATSDGALIVLSDSTPGRLLVDYGCTGIKGILAFAFIACIPIVESKQSSLRKLSWIAIALIGFCVASVLRLVVVCFAVMAWGQVAVDYHTTIGFGFFMAWLVVVTYFGSGPRQTAVQGHAGSPGTS